MILTDKLSNIANAIRSKTGKSEEMTLDEMPVEIEGIFGNKVEKPFDCHSVTFVYGDKSYVRSVADGDTCADPVERGLIPTPTKESTAQYNYTFYGWGASDGGAADDNILKNITSDKIVYAIFTATARLYTITWLDEDGTELPGQKQWAYGAVPSYTPTKDGVAFGGWNPEPVPVTGNASYTVVWSSVLASGTFSGTSVNWTMMSNGTLTISGAGAIPKFKGINITGMQGIYYKNSPIYSYASQIKKVAIEDGVTSIGDYTFYNEYTAIESVEIADSVTTIGNHAFNNCTSLAEVNIPYGVTSIGASAFSRTALTKVDIPDSVTSLGNSPFSNTKITSITIPASITQFGTQCFVYNYDLVSVKLMDGLTIIGTEMFRGCSALAEINIPSSVVTIGSFAFSDCTALKQVEIPSSITSWGSSVFSNSGLESVTLAGGITTIFTYMFNNAKALTEVSIPNTVTTIESRAFASCSALKEIEIPDSVTTIGGSAFEGCSSLEEVNIPAGVTSIGDFAFYNCAALEGIYVDDGNTAYCDIDGVLYNKSVTELIGAPSGFIGSIAIPSTVTKIGKRTFFSCTSLTSITIPNNVTSIGEYAFYDCTSLTSITIPNSVTSIGEYAFCKCDNLTSAIFEDTVGWWVSTSSTATSGDAVDVSGPTMAATLLKSTTHGTKYWFNS